MVYFANVNGGCGHYIIHAKHVLEQNVADFLATGSKLRKKRTERLKLLHNVFVKAAVISSHDRKGCKLDHYNHYDADIRAKSIETCSEAVVLIVMIKKRDM